jgi:glycosyltransferase involved in cell wall biosynthesis
MTNIDSKKSLRKLKILIACSEYPPNNHGGIGAFYKTYLDHAIKYNYFEVVLLTFGFMPIEDNIHIYTINSKYGLLRRIFFYFYCIIISIKHRIDIIETHDYGGYLPLPIPYPVKVIVRVHSTVTIIRKNLFLPRMKNIRFLELLTMGWGRPLIGVSEFILKKTIDEFKIKNREYSVVLNPVSYIKPKCPREITLPKKYLLFAGTMSFAKGIDVISKAFNIIADCCDESIFLVFSGKKIVLDDFNSSNEIYSRIDKKYHARVKILGHLPQQELRFLYSKALLVVCPTKFESSGLVVYEALLCRSLVIISRIEPFISHLQENTHLVMFEMGNYQDLAEKILFLISNPRFSKEITNKGFEYVKENHSCDVSLTQSVNFYKKMFKS